MCAAQGVAFRAMSRLAEMLQLRARGLRAVTVMIRILENSVHVSGGVFDMFGLDQFLGPTK